jgi:hypothetical protein
MAIGTLAIWSKTRLSGYTIFGKKVPSGIAKPILTNRLRIRRLNIGQLSDLALLTFTYVPILMFTACHGYRLTNLRNNIARCKLTVFSPVKKQYGQIIHYAQNGKRYALCGVKGVHPIASITEFGHATICVQCKLEMQKLGHVIGDKIAW